MEYSLPKTSFTLGLFLACLQTIYIVSGQNVTYSDLGENVTRMAFHNTDIYVGGVNFIARLSSTLNLLFKLSIGPVENYEHCASSSVPCDNIVRVMEIDSAQNMLLVCGSAYDGTCTFHSLPDISEWYCLYGDNTRDSADVSAGRYMDTSTVHFLTPTDVNSSSPKSTEALRYKCRSQEFGRHVYSNASNHLPDKTKTRTSRRVSNLMVAGLTKNSRSEINPIFLSLRQITFSGSFYSITYARGPNSKLIGLNLAKETESTFFLDYKLSFNWEDFSYFIFLQKSKCENSETCVITKVSRTCHKQSALLPYVEVPLTCENAGESYSLLTSASLGTVGLQLSSSYVTVPVLVAAFGKGSNPNSVTADPQFGTAVCAFTLDYLDKMEFNFALDTCGDGDTSGIIAKPVSWISGSSQECYNEPKKNGTCTSDTLNPYVQSAGLNGLQKLVVYLKDTSVVSILTHTQIFTATNGQTDLPFKTMDVYLLTNTGNVKKFSLEGKRSTSQWKYYLVENASQTSSQKGTYVTEFMDLKEAISLSSVGVTDHMRAVVYIASGSKVIKLKLDSCLHFETCAACHEVKTCHWCSNESRCFQTAAAEVRCPKALEAKCQPDLVDFSPKSVIAAGGTILTIYGASFGNQGKIKVTVCNQTCDNVIANDNNITCRVGKKCSSCVDECNITVNVSSRDSEGITSFSESLKYVTPVFSSFSPKHGPAFGGTVVTFKGQNIISGSFRNITVAGITCETKLENNSLTCRIPEDRQRRPQNGLVNISIDNFTTKLPWEFQFLENPTVKGVKPNKTIVSGGVTVEVEGSNLNSVISPLLKLTLPNRSTVSSGCCSVNHRGSRMTCKTPDLRSELKSINTTVKTTVNFNMDGVDLMNQLKSYVMTVYLDPIFFFDEEALQKTETFILKGRNIPTWINHSDITVAIGNITLKIKDVKNNTITCNASKVFDMYNINKEKNYYSVTPTKMVVITTSDRKTTTFSRTTLSSKGNTTPKTGHLNSTEASREQTPFADTNISQKEMNDSNHMRLNTSAVTTWPESEDNSSSNSTRTNISTTVSPSIRFSTTKNKKQPIGEVLYLNISVKVGNLEVFGRVKFGQKQNPNPQSQAAKLDIRLVGGAGGAGLLILVLVIVSCVMYVRAKKARALVSSLSGSQHGSRETAHLSLKQILQSVIEPNRREDMDKLIISLDCLAVGKIIGSGNFGCVFEGILSSDKEAQTQKVAVKTLQDPLSHSIDLYAFVQEAVIMREFQHPHVLGLIGLAEKEPGIPYVILPYMDNGDLLTFIRDSTVTLSLHDVIKFGADIASGMAYISDLKFVHRDLAARNCMLDSTYRVKVADFGLCRDIYEKGYYTSNNRKKLPIRWMAMESIEQGAFSTKSDVWSFGVVLWELLSRGVTPYPGVNGWDIINFLRHRRLAPPFFCPDELYNLMMKCWAKDPSLRPNFDTLPTELLLMIGQSPVVTDTMRRRRGELADKREIISKTGGKMKAEVNKGDVANVERKERAYTNILSPSSTTVLKNVMITFPACHSHRDVSKTAAGTYIKLVDNYEPPPKFSNPVLRSIKKRSKKTSSHHAQGMKKDHDSKADTSEYSFPGDIQDMQSSTDNTMRHEAEGLSQNSEDILNKMGPKESHYYELEETSLRSSAVSENHSSAWSMLNMTGSSASILDSQSHFSSISPSCSSSTSRLSVPYTHKGPHSSAPGTLARKISPLANPTKNSELKEVQLKRDGANYGKDRHTELITSL